MRPVSPPGIPNTKSMPASSSTRTTACGTSISSGIMAGRLSRLRELLPRFLRDPRALEEARVLRAPQVDGVGEREVAEVVLGDHAVLDQLVRLGERIAHVDHVEVADVRAVERVELGAERVGLAERPAVGAIVGLAA